MTNWGYGARSVRQTSQSVTYTYEEIRFPTTRRGPCPACGKRRTRSTTFTATLNPLNRDPETGRPRTRGQIMATLVTRAEAWTPDFTCAGCA